MCIWQMESAMHLFNRGLLGFHWNQYAPLEQQQKNITMLKRRIGKPFSMEVIILMTWAI
jgi:hypothetical protein